MKGIATLFAALMLVAGCSQPAAKPTDAKPEVKAAATAKCPDCTADKKCAKCAAKCTGKCTKEGKDKCDGTCKKGEMKPCCKAAKEAGKPCEKCKPAANKPAADAVPTSEVKKPAPAKAC